MVVIRSDDDKTKKNTVRHKKGQVVRWADSEFSE